MKQKLLGLSLVVLFGTALAQNQTNTNDNCLVGSMNQTQTFSGPGPQLNFITTINIQNNCPIDISLANYSFTFVSSDSYGSLVKLNPFNGSTNNISYTGSNSYQTGNLLTVNMSSSAGYPAIINAGSKLAIVSKETAKSMPGGPGINSYNTNLAKQTFSTIQPVAHINMAYSNANSAIYSSTLENIPLGTSGLIDYTIINNSDSALQLQLPTLAAPFSYYDSPTYNTCKYGYANTSMAAGSSCTVVIQYTPITDDSHGTIPFMLSGVTDNSNIVTSSLINIPYSSQQYGIQLALDTAIDHSDLTNVKIGRLGDVAYNVTNLSNNPIQLIFPQLEADFTYKYGQNNTCLPQSNGGKPISLNTQDTCVVEIRYTPPA